MNKATGDKLQMVRGIFIATLLDYADQALYHSKHNPRF